MKEIRTQLRYEERMVPVEYDGRKLTVDSKSISPRRASLEVKRLIPLYVVIMIMIGVVLGGMVVGAVIGDRGIAIISVSISGGISAILYFALSRVEQVLMIDTKDGSFELKGSNDDLRTLYYEISKVTIKKMKEKEKETTDTRGIGVTRGNELFNKKDLTAVKNDLKRKGIISKKVITQLCPECGNDELYFEGGLMAGHVYHCKRCDYVGSFVIEKEIDFRD